MNACPACPLLVRNTAPVCGVDPPDLMRLIGEVAVPGVFIRPDGEFDMDDGAPRLGGVDAPPVYADMCVVQ